MNKHIFDHSEVTANSKQLEVLKKHFPQCFDKHGAFMPEKLQDLVSASGSELSKESYALNWLGKSYARLLANENPRTLLSEDKEHNTKPENKASENLLIKGDNLEVLKHLVNAYSEQVKMIYIDPPYNTGSDGFVYQDDRKFTAGQLSQLAGIDKDEAQRILDFTQSKANSHSAWLTFMYPRLYVARELLKDDGVIFISIDDNEVAQLKMLCDEIFGEHNLVAQVARVAKRTSDKGTHFRPTKDYILVYAKNIEKLPEFGIKKDVDESAYTLADGNGRKYKKSGASLYQPSLDPLRGCTNQRYYIEAPDGSLIIPPGNVFPKKKEDAAKIKPVSSDDNVWRWSVDTYLKQKDKLIFTKGSAKNPLVDENGNQSKWNIYPKVFFDDDVKATLHPEDIIYDYPNSQGTKELKGLSIPFSFSKPTGLISFLLKLVGGENGGVIIDFFAGSGTTAHAVMQLNADDGGNRRCISVQIDEATDKKSEAYKTGYKTIFEITKARLEKAAVKIKEENPDYSGDLGFKIFEIKPLPEDYLQDIPTLSDEQQTLPLMSDDVDDMLTTWKVYDGIALTKDLQEVDLKGYTAYQYDKVCYLMHKGFSSKALVAFLQKLDDTSNHFEVEKLVVNAVVFDSKYQREIHEAITQYKNKKDKHISVEFRY